MNNGLTERTAKAWSGHRRAVTLGGDEKMILLLVRPSEARKRFNGKPLTLSCCMVGPLGTDLPRPAGRCQVLDHSETVHLCTSIDLVELNPQSSISWTPPTVISRAFKSRMI